MKLKIFTNLNFKNEHLPKDTGLGGPAIRQQKPINLNNPSVSIKSNQALMAQLNRLNPIQPASIRAATKERLTAAIASVNSQIEGSARFRGIKFGHHEASNRHFAVVRDKKTGEVLKTIPGEAFLEMAGRLKELSGLLVDVVG